MDRGAWWATVHGGDKESDMTEQLILSLIYIYIYIYVVIDQIGRAHV